MYVHEEVLAAANQIAGRRNDWTFSPYEVVAALPTLKESSVRTHVVSRCCVNAPVNHLHKWDYFRRIGRGRYEVRSKYRQLPVTAARNSTASETASASPLSVFAPEKRTVIHAVVRSGQDALTAECLEIAAVTQGNNLDEVVHNLYEVIALYFEGEDLAAMGFSDQLRLQVIFEAPLKL